MSILDLLAPAVAFAAGGGEHHAPSITDILWPLGNFIIYLVIIVKFALPLVRDFLRNRRQEVLDTVQSASAKKQAAEALVSEYKGKLAGVDREIQTLENTLRDEGQREKTKLIDEANGLATKIKDDARVLADQEVKMARQRVREEMANRAEATARELVQRNLSAADQGRLVDDFIQSIGQAR